jgi:5-methylcytosine-specific restriction endonuclease McrA
MFLASFSFEMANKDIQGFYYTQAWKNAREAYKRSKGGLCERCLDKGYIVPGEIVHHKIRLTPENINDPNISLNWDNLQLVCRKCHAEIHEDVYEEQKQTHHRSKKRYWIDRSGRICVKKASP